jgi:EAL domain-containing protein (putative c-di-GMP-specific phosphodiesterase class I)
MTEVMERLSMGQESPEERNERLLDVIREEKLEPVFQPIMELDTGRVIAFEALSRFPGDPAYTPDRWFGDAWSVGLGMELELLAVRKITDALTEIPPEIGLSINASPPTAATSAFIHELWRDAGRITVELTENLEIDDVGGLRTALAPLSGEGTKTAIDDFGAGHANFEHILGVHPDWIKLDISLTERVDEEDFAHDLARDLVGFGTSMGAGVIAEGIETIEELDALQEIGVRYGQGFHLGMPEPLNKALEACV